MIDVFVTFHTKKHFPAGMRISLLYANYCYLKHEGLLYLLITKVHISSHYKHKMFCILSLNILYIFSVVYGAYFLWPL